MAFLRYSALRLLVFLVVAALLWIVGIRDYWLLLFAVLISGVLSLFVLSRSRDELSSSIVNRRERIRQRLAERAAAEDAWNDQVRGADGQVRGVEDRIPGGDDEVQGAGERAEPENQGGST